MQIQRITDSVFDACQEMEEPIPIDAIEDMIEKKLMGAEAYEVAKKYITYRYEKERVRNNKSLTEKLTASNVVNQNANIDEFSFGGRIGESASYVMKEYALNNLISELVQDRTKARVGLKEWSNLMFGAALTMSTLFPDEPTVQPRVEELVNKAVEDFDNCQKLAERLFPKVFAKEESASTEKKD